MVAVTRATRVLTCTAGLLAVCAVSVSVTEATSQDDVERCLLSGERPLTTGRTDLGATVPISLVARPHCQRREVIVAYGTFGRHDGHWYLQPTVDWLELVDFRGAQMGITGRVLPRLIQPLTDDKQLLAERAAIAFDGERDVVISLLIKVSTDYLLAVREEPLRAAPDQAILLLAHQIHGGDEAQSLRESRRAQAAGIEVYTVGIANLFRALASSRAHSFEWSAATPGQARGALTRAAGQAFRAVEETLYGLEPDTLVISDTLPADLEYVAGSAGPDGAWDPVSRTVSWTIPQPGVITQTRSFEVRPLVCGRLPLSEGGMAQAFLAGSLVASHTYDIPLVDVDCPTVTPTPSSTATPTTTATASPTRTGEPTTTRAPRPVYLPVALSEPPCRAVRRTDAALVLDTSSSMLAPTSSGRTKLAAAAEAAEAFLDLLALPEDQAAIIAFDSEARVLAGLTGNRAALTAALTGITNGSGTRIHLGIGAAQAELTGPARREASVPVMVVLTDGRASPDGPAIAVAAASAAKAEGIVIFTIGLGDDLDRAPLREMASRGEWYFEAPDAEELRQIYESIAVEIPCPPGTFWGRR